MSLHSFFTYPLDVIKTNRMVGSKMSLQAHGSLQLEMVALQQGGNMWRGMLMALPLKRISMYYSGNSIDYFCGLFTMALLNPLFVMQTKMQIVASEQVSQLSYAQVMKNLNVKMLYLGVGANFCSNAAISAGFYPMWTGMNDYATHGIAAVAGCIFSHPFEVARAMIVNNGSGNALLTLKDLFMAEGVSGLFRGFVPRTLTLAPAIAIFSYMGCQV